MKYAFIYASIFSPLPAIIQGVRYARSLSNGLRFILLLIIASFATDITMFLVRGAGISNIIFAHIFGLVEVILLSLFFATELSEYKKFIIYILFLVIGFYVYDSFVLTGLNAFNAYSRSLEAAVMILFSVLFFFKIYKNETNIFIDSTPVFWAAVAILVYFSGAFFSFLLASDILSQSTGRFYNSWVLHNISNILKNIIFLIALCQVNRN